jgi:hypothetical protein
MNTGQTMLTIAALAMLSIITMRYYASVGYSGRSLAMSNTGLTSTTVATSLIERAQNTPFDAKGDTAYKPLKYPNLLTRWDSLGPDSYNETLSIDSLNDFDDFNGFTYEYAPGWMSEKYKAKFSVYYIDTNDIATRVNKRTFLKRMDIKVWRSYPAHDTTEGGLDTVRMSTIYGYFKYVNQ